MGNRLSSVIAPSFISVHKDIKEGRHTHYWLKGGRGSTKSSFISVELILGIMRDAQLGLMTNAIAFRRYGSDNPGIGIRTAQLGGQCFGGGSLLAGGGISHAAGLYADRAEDYFPRRG